MAFRNLVEQIRRGDSEAYEKLLREYGPQILREARLRLGRSPARGLCDAEDVYQSVLRSLFRRVSSGQFSLEHPGQLVALLVSMARNKAIDRVRAAKLAPWTQSSVRRKPESSLRDVRANQTAEEMAARELLEHYQEKLSGENRDILLWRVAGQTWGEIAATLGRQPDAVRKQFRRAMQIVDDAHDRNPQ